MYFIRLKYLYSLIRWKGGGGMFILFKNVRLCVCSELVLIYLIVKIFLIRRLGMCFKFRMFFLLLFK